MLVWNVSRFPGDAIIKESDIMAAENQKSKAT